MMEALLVLLSVRELHNAQNHLLSDSTISGFKNLEKLKEFGRINLWRQWDC